ncbi:hypothetical protein [Sulfitobacter sabulilitoris]|uniref:DUF3726 domain-containing protein n=1 Tax=Sulfitobacter sabulilitoris TaxID=2562655 RepID=A0A5S3PNV0_9RHOB|nr:hypothetical protein [Sulfitobacter sabulilitoris]TMM55270.1 hypothetical protein FDT80_06850 [Sulfitobacter sabulilitoris]
MSWSMTEWAALAAKAARGAGAPPAQAQAFGRAAAQHLAQGRAAEDLARALGALPGGPILSLPPALIAAQVDAGTGLQTTLAAPDGPALAQSYVEGLPWRVTVLRAEGGTLCFALDTGTPAPRATPARLTPPPALVKRMEALAERTFVPETDASRQRGAGAGLTDSD